MGPKVAYEPKKMDVVCEMVDRLVRKRRVSLGQRSFSSHLSPGTGEKRTLEKALKTKNPAEGQSGEG